MLPPSAPERFSFEDCDRRVDNYLGTIRRTILFAHGNKGRKNCPEWAALEFMIKRSSTVLAYWQAAFDEKMVLPKFEGNGWAVESSKQDEGLHANNIVMQLSSNANLNKANKVKVLSCNCKAKTRPCSRNCSCKKRGASCILGYCACDLRCMLGDTNREPQLNDEGCAGRLEGLDLELSSDGDSDDTDDEAASMTACDGTFEEIGLDL